MILPLCPVLNRSCSVIIRLSLVTYCLLITVCAAAQTSKNRISIPSTTEQATLQDSLDVYNNAKAVEAFYEHTGLYSKTRETKLLSDDPAKQHAGNDKKYAEVLSTINNYRLTPQGKRKIKPEEYRINIDKYRYKQRELSDYVLNTDAPMQLFDRRIAPQILVDYAYTGFSNSAMNADDVDFKMYDPIAVKPYSKLTPEEKVERTIKYPKSTISVPIKTITPAPPPKPVKATQPHVKAANSEFVIAGSVPDSLRFKRFKTRKEAEAYIKHLPVVVEGE